MGSLRDGLALDRSTLAFWGGYAAAEIAPVVSRLKEILLGSARVFADETTVPVLDPGRGRTKTGYFWAVARDDRPWGGADPPAVVYSYAPGRGQEHNDQLLGAYRGILQCDGYATYKKLADPERGKNAVTLVFCWSHTIRTQSRFGRGWCPWPGHGVSQRDDMLDLQAGATHKICLACRVLT